MQEESRADLSCISAIEFKICFNGWKEQCNAFIEIGMDYFERGNRTV